MGFGFVLARLDMSFHVVPEKEFPDIDGFYKIRSVDMKTSMPYFARNIYLVDDDENTIVKSKIPPVVFLKTGIKFTLHDKK